MSNNAFATAAFERYVSEVVAVTRATGMSASKVNTFQFLGRSDTWGFPKHPGRTAILAPEIDVVAAIKVFIAANAQVLAAPDAWLGTWVHPQTGCYYLDITTSRNHLDEARAAAWENSLREGRQIVALYNTWRQEIVYLTPTEVQ
jgi:hypothetical protein